MKLTVIGTGYVGLTSGAMFAELGHQVTCVDKDKDKVKMLKTGKVPFYEPGLDNLVRKHLDYNIKFTTSLSAAEASKVIIT
ncbi:MAG: NAD-binding protein, partial [Firmicutes bacterium]|nr:NAD-binding protein [Bacillota bacterium]